MVKSALKGGLVEREPLSLGVYRRFWRLSCLALLFVAGCGDPCGTGTVDKDGECVAAYPERTCGEGTLEDEGTCVAAYPERVCGEQTVELDGHCVVDSNIGECSRGTILRDDTCIKADLQFMGLPFAAGEKVTISQGNHGYASHSGAARYAVDFPVPEGTTAVAARSGVVWRVKEDSNTGCDNESCAEDGNFVEIDHGDGTIARYYHLKVDGALVKAGDVVCKGQPIGLTGNTGWSSGPHLHLEVTDLFTESLPMVFDELPGPGAPVAGGNYTSSNAAPASCSEALSNSTCPAGTFQHMGVTLDAGVPCAVASFNTSYAVSGQSQLPGSMIQIATRLTASDMWKYSCVKAGADGRFTSEVTWSPMDTTNFSFLMIGVANESCESYQGWDASVRIELH